MKRTGPPNWKACRWTEAGGKSVGMRAFSSREKVAAFLRRFRNDPSAMAAFRKILKRSGMHGVNGLDHDTVLAQTALRISRREWRLLLGELPKPESAGANRKGSLPPAPPPPPSVATPVKSTPSRKPAPEEPVFPPEDDVLAIAAILKEAASAGVPFCEECAKAEAAAGGDDD